MSIDWSVNVVPKAYRTFTRRTEVVCRRPRSGMMRAMQDSLITVAFAVAILAGAVAIYLLVSSGRVFGQVGQGGFDVRDGTPGSDGDEPGEREQDIREMLDARNAHREARGEESPDVEEELAELLQ